MTTYDVSLFKRYRTVVHRDGTKEQCLAVMKKSLYSVGGLAQLMHLTPLARRVITAVVDIKNNLMVPRLAAAGAEN